MDICLIFYSGQITFSSFVIYDLLPSGEGVYKEGSCQASQVNGIIFWCMFSPKSLPSLYGPPANQWCCREGVYRQRCCSTSPPLAALRSCKRHHIMSHFSKAGDVTQHDEDAVWCVLLQQARKNICHQYFCFSSICTWLFFLQVPVLFFFHILRHPAAGLLSYVDCHGQSVCPTDARKSKEISIK